MDSFHNPAATRKRRGDLSAEGYYLDSFNLGAVVEEVLVPLGPNGSRRFRPAMFDYRSDEPIQAESVTVTADTVVLFDGVFLLRPELRPFWDLSIYLDVTPEQSLRRALTRDIRLFGSSETIEERYTHRYLPGQALYRREAMPDETCDILIDLNGVNHPVVIRPLNREHRAY